ncbi:putative glycosyl [Erysiphe neolycopersici]|uniref:Putative glycosyl n=1 Tax=Erysiphe neolycopersici TaxID=212602 RepID=A0A420I084_9PEZI|nr:putative glycosyl [Erysiphe neolycopersici]
MDNQRCFCVDIYSDCKKTLKKESNEDNISERKLHELWNLDFEFFSSVEYKKTTAQTKALRDFFRSRNMFIPRKGYSIATELLKAQTTSWAPMPDEYLHEIDEKHWSINFSSKSTNTLYPDSTRTRVEANTTNSYSFIDLMKIYNDEAKYEGSSSDLFDSKFETFCENCDKTCIGEEDRNRAFSFMLKENALEHYRALIRENKGIIPSLNSLYKSIKNVFEGQEHEQMLLAKWNELSLPTIINKQKGSKDVEKALATLTSKPARSSLVLTNN